MDERPLWLRHQNANFVLFMACGGTSKLFATTLAYPHGRCASITSNADAEVARTRMREEGDKYRKFVQTVRLVIVEEGPRALYRLAVLRCCLSHQGPVGAPAAHGAQHGHHDGHVRDRRLRAA